MAAGLALTDRRQRAGAALLLLFGVASGWLGATFPCDAGCAGETPTGLAHNLFGLVGFVSVVAAMFVLPRRWTSDASWDRLARATRRLRLVAAAGLTWFVATQALEAQSTAGIAQRVLAASVLSWIGATGWTIAHARR